MSLQYLSFASSEDGAGHGSWEAMASVRPAQLAAARAECARLLAWAEAQAPGPRGPLDAEGVWDAELQEQAEADGWTTLTLTLVGPLEWGEALLQQLGLDP